MSCFHVGETCANWKTITNISDLTEISDLKSIKTESKKQPLFQVNTACSQHLFFIKPLFIKNNIDKLVYFVAKYLHYWTFLLQYFGHLKTALCD